MRTTKLIALLAAVGLSGCDEGTIYPDTAATVKEGVSVRVNAELDGADSWGNGIYRVAVAGFAEAGEYAVIVKNVDTDGTAEPFPLTLSGIDAEVTTVELCVIDNLRRRVTTLASVDISGVTAGATVDLDAGRVDASMLGAIQREVFSTTCANCHGASNHAAAGLYLTEGQSRSNLVGVESTVMPGTRRVEPGDASSSLLYQAISTDISAGWHYDHSVEIPSESTRRMIKDWIDGGAR